MRREWNWTGWVEGMLGLVALALVVTFFVGQLMGRHRVENHVLPDPPAEETTAPQPPQPSRTPQPSQPVSRTAGGFQPGVPTKPVSEHETFPAMGDENPDRQLDVTSSTVTYPKGLGDDVEAYASQELTWEDCKGGQCAVVKVPLDWDNPGHATIDIALLKVPSKNPEHGPLFVNPGGPGEEGQGMARQLGADYVKGYDTIGWDPRGTGKSTSVTCGTTEQTDAFFGLDHSPDNQAESKALDEGAKEFARLCRANSGELLDHLTTVDVVRDLDLLRHLLGAPKLNYVGVSYGTYVGAMYAELFPERTGRLVLDAAVDITGGETPVSQAEGFDNALAAFAEWCAKDKTCFVGNSKDDVLDAINDFLVELDGSPIEVDDRDLTQTLAARGIALFLYSDESFYPYLSEALGLAMDEGDGEVLLVAGDAMNGRMDDKYETLAFAFPAMRCADEPDGGVDRALPADVDAEDATTLSDHLGYSVICERWTADSGPQIKITATGAPEILVIGSTGDSATPYEQAVSMAKQLDKGVLLTYEGAGHGATVRKNDCVTKAVDAFLIEGAVPAEGTRCKR